MNQPTKKQIALLKFIDDFTTKNNHSPSYREIQTAMGLGSVATVAQHIENCVTAGYLRKIPNAARSLEIVPIKDYKETTDLFRNKLFELNGKLESGEELSEQKTNSIKDDILALKAAAKILGIDL